MSLIIYFKHIKTMPQLHMYIYISTYIYVYICRENEISVLKRLCVLPYLGQYQSCSQAGN